MKIGIIVGSTRPGRLGAQVAQWAYDTGQAADLGDVELELVELADYDLDLLDDPAVPGGAKRQYASEKTRRWSEKIDSLDAFVFVTPEYNHGVPAALKNAVDVIWPEWNHKAAGVLAYGYDGGTRAVEQWRTILPAVHVHVVRSQISLSLHGDFEDEQTFVPAERRAKELRILLKAVAKLGAAVSTLRA
ncbi:NADPH-dependent FMN reductase [Janibacter melonis]|uniref:NADPH-dependent FMN reductase n=1 Tax=Janibacter melonis TaxID=262209 RepID=A0A176QCR0_9MICO|nr:NADPH-dependent FMN reductase [Janibacter melonis]OAB87491.1 NADPH-dependent FMN reductase [Janibacter melonis]